MLGPDWLVGSGEIAELIRRTDWSESPLGPIDAWPESLRTTVSLILASSFPINLIWGDQATQIWNDGYAVVCGDKHPAEFGSDYRVCWASAWPAIGPAFEAARAGETAYLTDQPMFLDRLGFLEETWFTFSLSPIYDDRGQVAGLFHPVTETTAHNLGQRRTRTLRDLTERMSQARRAADAVTALVEVLGRATLDVPLAALYLRSGEAPLELAAWTGVQDADPAVLSALGDGVRSPVHEAIGSGERVDVADLRARCGEIVAGPHAQPLERLIAYPLRPAGADDLRGALVLGFSTRLPHDEAYASHLELISRVISSGLAGAISRERERARAEQLAELDRAKTTFFSNVSHELRTPLTLMLGPVEDELARGDALAGESRARLEMVHRSAMRLLYLVNSLLDFSRVEAGRIDASYEPIDLGAYTADLASLFRSAIEKAGLEFTVDCDTSIDRVFVDRSMWEKVVTNLLSNALKYTFAGEIAVRLDAPPGGGARLTVRDTGIGIAANELPLLFERFHRVQDARSRSIEGAGIGLALVRELVTLHAGDVSVDSREGHGTTFTVTLKPGSSHLPAAQVRTPSPHGAAAGLAAAHAAEALNWVADEPSVPAGREPNGAITPERLGRIVVVDDNSDMRRHIRQILEPQFEVIPHRDGQSALEAVAADRPDLVLTDVMMPRLDGFGLLRALRAEPQTRTLPVIMLSARAGEEAALEGIDAGADDYLVKPFSARELLARVSGALAHARLRRETEQSLAAMNRELAAATLAKSQFLANMSHEIRTPMNAIIGMTALLLDTELSGEQAEFADTIRGAGEHLLTVVNDILDFSKIEAGLMDLQLDAFSVAICVEESIELVAQAAARKRLQLLSSVAPDVPAMVVGDQGRLRQVLVNLLGNAVKFTDSGEVALTVSAVPTATGTRLTFVVRDTGIGIAEGELQRLFDAFVQVDGSMTRARDGSGLGLSISLALCRLMGGDLTVTSTVGEGSTFSATIEAAIAEQSAGAEQQADEDLRGLRALVVDDDPTAQRITTTHLRSWGIEPVAVSSPDAALALVLAREAFDFCLLDFAMRGMSCLELIRRLRDAESGRDLPILVLSSETAGREDLDELAAERIALHHKPVQKTDLHEAVRALGAARGPSAPVRRPAFDPATATRNPLRILIVEDQPMNQRLLIRMLDRLGYEPDVAHDGLAAIELAAATRYDVILMDLQMPKVDGFETTRRLRASQHDELRIVGLTGHASDATRAACFEAGMNEYITKPFTVEQLVAALRPAAGRRDQIAAGG